MSDLDWHKLEALEQKFVKFARKCGAPESALDLGAFHRWLNACSPHGEERKGNAE